MAPESGGCVGGAVHRRLLTKPWHSARPGVKVKLLPEDNELYVFAESQDRIAKERSMRRRKLKWLWARLAQLQGMELSRDELLMKRGSGFTYQLNRKTLKIVLRREGRYLLRTNLTETDPVKL